VVRFPEEVAFVSLLHSVQTDCQAYCLITHSTGGGGQTAKGHSVKLTTRFHSSGSGLKKMVGCTFTPLHALMLWQLIKDRENCSVHFWQWLTMAVSLHPCLVRHCPLCEICLTHTTFRKLTLLPSSGSMLYHPLRKYSIAKIYIS
jgi:hypothetical protein